jgi:hypothetical protein
MQTDNDSLALRTGYSMSLEFHTGGEGRDESRILLYSSWLNWRALRKRVSDRFLPPNCLKILAREPAFPDLQDFVKVKSSQSRDDPTLEALVQNLQTLGLVFVALY